MSVVSGGGGSFTHKSGLQSEPGVEAEGHGSEKASRAVGGGRKDSVLDAGGAQGNPR